MNIPLIADVLILVIACLHFYFMALEMFFWTKKLGLKTFGHSLENAKISKVLAANQGLYNGFLGLGLLWALIEKSKFTYDIRIFFLLCVLMAGIYGAISTKNKKIFFVQALPALVALFFNLMLFALANSELR